MSRVFISYAHEDQKQFGVLDTFVAELKKTGFTDKDIWSDSSIEAGSQWHAAIDTALEESFAVVVLLAPAAMKSAYVTYEWSWALGSGTPLMPLLLKGNYDQIHARLRVDRQCTDCRAGIPSHVIDRLKEYHETPRDTEYLNRLIMEAVMPFRILARVSLWLYPYVKNGLVEHKFVEDLLNLMVDKARELHSGKLPDLMTSRHGFTSQQSRKCRQLMKSILDFWFLFFAPAGNGHHFELHLLPDIVPKAEDYRRNQLEISIADFDIIDVIDRTYKEFDLYLESISLNRNPIQVPIIGIGPPRIIGWYIDDEKLVREIQSIIYELATKQGN